MNAVAGSAGMFDERIDPGRISSYVLAAAVHLLLFAILVFGVSWQNRPPESIAVELWEPPPPAPAVETPKPLPQVEPPPPAAVQPEPVKPEPVVPKPEIVEKKAPPPKPKAVPKPVLKVEPKPVLKAVPKPVAKAEPLKPRVDDTQKRMREELAREQTAIAVVRESQRIGDQQAKDAGAATAKAQATWIDKVRAKIRGNIVLPPDIKGNPETIVSVAQLPNGEVLSVKIKKSSGMAVLDSAIERAVLKSSALPKPDGAGFVAPREFEFRYRPFE